MRAKVRNPRKKFLWQIVFINRPINSFLFQSVTLPEVNIEQTEHGDVNRSVKTGGRITVGNLICNKLETTSGSDTWAWDQLASIQDMLLGGGQTPSNYWDSIMVNELAEDGVSIINSWICDECWLCRINGQELDRMSSDNTIETMEFSVGTVEKL